MSRDFERQSSVTTREIRITAGALRMRETRRRRREGLRCITLDLRDVEIDRLVELGHLRQADREDKNQVLLALYRFLDGSALGDVHRFTMVSPPHALLQKVSRT
jgi:hypothetical protein